MQIEPNLENSRSGTPAGIMERKNSCSVNIFVLLTFSFVSNGKKLCQATILKDHYVGIKGLQ